MMYKSMGSVIRDILTEKKNDYSTAPGGGPEKDMNDQVAVGTYHTKSFEMSTKAQKLYSELPKTVNILDAEGAAGNLDKLFAIYKDVKSKKYASEADRQTAENLVARIHLSATQMNLAKDHDDITSGILKDITSMKESGPKQIIDPDEHQHPSDDPRFKTSSKEYNTDKKNDRDVDNVKNYFLKKSLKAQRQLKITDAD